MRKRKKKQGGPGLAIIILGLFIWLSHYSLKAVEPHGYEVSVFSILPAGKPYRTHDRAALSDLWAGYSTGELRHDLPEDN